MREGFVYIRTIAERYNIKYDAGFSQNASKLIPFWLPRTDETTIYLP